MSWSAGQASPDDQGVPWIEVLGIGLGLLYVFGYLSERSAHAFLGIWSFLPLLSERYAQSGGLFLLNLLEVLVFPIGLIGITSILILRIFRYLFSFGQWLDSLGAVLCRAVRALRGHASWIYLCLTFLLTKTVDVFFRERIGRFGVLLTEDTEWISLDPVGWVGRFSILVIVVLVSCWALYWLRFPRSGWPAAKPWLQAYLGVLISFQLLLLPIHHGLAMAGDAAVPIAEIHDQVINSEEPPQAVALLFQNERELVIYDGRKIQHMQRDQLGTLSLLCFRKLADIHVSLRRTSGKSDFCKES